MIVRRRPGVIQYRDRVLKHRLSALGREENAVSHWIPKIQSENRANLISRRVKSTGRTMRRRVGVCLSLIKFVKKIVKEDEKGDKRAGKKCNGIVSTSRVPVEPRLSRTGFIRLKPFPSSQLFYYSEVRTRQREVSFHQRVEFNAETFILLRDAIFCLPSNRKMFINLIKRKSHYIQNSKQQFVRSNAYNFFDNFEKKEKCLFLYQLQSIDRIFVIVRFPINDGASIMPDRPGVFDLRNV